LLSHGYSATSQVWGGQIEALSRRHQLIVWDMRGHGRSDYPQVVSAYSEETTVADNGCTAGFIRSHQAIVSGLSLGGYVSLAFHRVHPERVRALLIVDTGPGFKNDEARERWNQRARSGVRQPFRDRGLGYLR
jgi:pimeloyl-ACP methyl ester carboxylesterase